MYFTSQSDSSQDSQSNGFVASLKENSATKMGLLHAAYGSSPRTYLYNAISTNSQGLCSIRARSYDFTTRCNTIRANTAMVFSLPLLVRHRYFKYDILAGRVSWKDTGWLVHSKIIPIVIN